MSRPSWIRRPRPVPEAKVRLFCVPHAGAGPSVYAHWPAELSLAAEVCLVHLPGRESRFAEPLLDDIDAIADAVRAAAEPLLDKPFALFGHSMGALVCYEMAHRLPREPVRLFASGSPPPHLPPGEVIAHLPDAGFLAGVRRGTGDAADPVWDDQELVRLLLPVLRADFAACERYRWPLRPPLRCDVVALCGAGDRFVSHTGLARWAELTTGRCATHVIGHGHFNVVSERAAVHRLIREELGLVPAMEGVRHD
jgi:pyochelin biosynthesis protein PchC